MKEKCPVCGVEIEDGLVLFSHGEPGTKGRLFARVCQYAKDKASCINDTQSSIREEDYYTTPKDLTDPQDLLNKYKNCED